MVAPFWRVYRRDRPNACRLALLPHPGHHFCAGNDKSTIEENPHNRLLSSRPSIPMKNFQDIGIRFSNEGAQPSRLR